jgi:hypothetical protein
VSVGEEPVVVVPPKTPEVSAVSGLESLLPVGETKKRISVETIRYVKLV